LRGCRGEKNFLEIAWLTRAVIRLNQLTLSRIKKAFQLNC